jgi:hypothetical protein
VCTTRWTPDPAALYIQHPIQDRTDDEMREIADRAFEEVLARLVDRS